MEKKSVTNNYIQIDIAKFIAALLVVAIHIPPLKNVTETGSLLLQQVICRLAVPFFFLCSGFFLGKKVEDKTKTLRYAKRIGMMYLLWSILYLPMILERFWKTDLTAGANLTELARRFFLIGSYIQLWYLLATLYGVLFLYLAIHVLKCSKRQLAVLAVLIYLVGVACNSYRHLWDGFTIVSDSIQAYRNLFVTTRNGLFFAFPFLAAGYLLAEWKEARSKKTLSEQQDAVGDLKQESFKKKLLWGIAVLASLTVLFVEFYVLYRWGEIASFDMFLLTPVAVIFIFIFLLQIHVPEKYRGVGKVLRQLSTNIFLLHMMLNFYLKRVPVLKDTWMEYSVTHFILVLVSSIGISMIMMWVSEKRK